MAIGSKRRSAPWSAEEEAELRALVAANTRGHGSPSDFNGPLQL